ncbi:endo-1,4-beta-xylanase [Cohnella herbarum]|uniref:endo-1,4-beta-xylanase n=1 Tax=Cohnella herbarum TaxID=2728023 RepID=UPI0015815721|nr:endo-1,4-beta-xylanase [Cohnella herbarum]
MADNINRSIPKLHEAFQGYFDIGAAVNPRTIVEAGELIASHYNSLTAENEMKFISLHPAEDTYTFEAADQIVGFAREHGKKMRGHTLVWHNQTSDWLFQDSDGGSVSRDTLLARLKSHIDTVVKRYQGDIYAWDVVNEAIADEGAELLRSSKWLEIAGPSFIAKAFEFAHEADPKALLFYNDYNESHPMKREKIYALLQSLRSQGVPVHGVGLQAHWNLYDPGLDEIRAAIERYASLGLVLHLTEMDVSVFRFEDRRADLTAPTEEMLELQARKYEVVFSMLREYRDVIDSVTFWGAADDYTWLDDFPVRGRKNWPLLFDEKHQPKPSFWGVVSE